MRAIKVMRWNEYIRMLSKGDHIEIDKAVIFDKTTASVLWHCRDRVVMEVYIRGAL